MKKKKHKIFAKISLSMTLILHIIFKTHNFKDSNKVCLKPNKNFNYLSVLLENGGWREQKKEETND